jgi:hypothetical protein
MREKILAAIKASLSQGGQTQISDKTLGAYVELVAGQITDEGQIASAIVPHVAVLREVQLNINSVAAQAVKAKEAELAGKAKEAELAGKLNPPTPTPPVPGTPTPVPGTPDALLTVISELKTSLVKQQETLNNLLVEKTHGTLSQRVTSTLKEKNIPDWFSSPALEGRTFKDEAEATAFSETLAAKWDAAKQDLANQGFKETVPPQAGASAVENDSTGIAKLIDDGTKTIVTEQQTKK